jgi:PLP dependent protein
VWQTIDRVELGRQVAKRAPGARVLVQVNVSDEPAKGGCHPDGVDSLVAALTDDGLAVEGLMTVGRTGPPELARPGFRLLAELADAHGLPVRSMGMTDDLEVAVEEGSTMVRVGSALFGPRPRPEERAN